MSLLKHLDSVVLHARELDHEVHVVGGFLLSLVDQLDFPEAEPVEPVGLWHAPSVVVLRQLGQSVHQFVAAVLHFGWGLARPAPVCHLVAPYPQIVQALMIKWLMIYKLEVW